MMMRSCILLSAALLGPTAALAQSGDAAYCSALANKYQHYIGQNDAAHRAQNPMASINNAIGDCNSGKSASAIPVLEKALQDAKIELPPRG